MTVANRHEITMPIRFFQTKIAMNTTSCSGNDRDDSSTLKRVMEESRREYEARQWTTPLPHMSKNGHADEENQQHPTKRQKKAVTPAKQLPIHRSQTESIPSQKFRATTDQHIGVLGKQSAAEKKKHADDRQEGGKVGENEPVFQLPPYWSDSSSDESSIECSTTPPGFEKFSKVAVLRTSEHGQEIWIEKSFLGAFLKKT